MQVKFLPAAKSRLLEVWAYTESTWGESQADCYLRGLVDSIQQSAELRHRWRPVRDEKLSGPYFIRYQRHYIFFRELSPDTIGVISVLHEKMNIPARLREDSVGQDDE